MQNRFSIAEKGWQASRQGGDRHCIAFVEGVQLAFWKGRAGRVFGLANTDKGIELPRTTVHITHTHTDFTQLTQSCLLRQTSKGKVMAVWGAGGIKN